jgi:hypothetical protein
MKTMTRCAIVGWVLMMPFFLAGCGDSATPYPKEDLVEVSGTVKLGGRPVAGIQVAFVPTGSTAGQGASAVG